MNIIEELGAAKVVGITGHIRPDGDCTGSVLGLYNYLKDNAPDIDVNVYLDSHQTNYHILMVLML